MTELSEADERYLRRAFALAREAREEGNQPFAGVLVDSDGNVVLEQKNESLFDQHGQRRPHIDRTAHSETLLAHKAAKLYSPEDLANYTIYMSCGPCVMCAGSMYWAGIGRMVYGMTERQLLEMTGDNPENPTLDVPCEDVYARGQLDIEVIGPVLVEEAKAIHEGFWAYDGDGGK